MKVILLLPGLGAEIEMYIPSPHPYPPTPHLSLNPPESKGRERLKLSVTHIPLSFISLPPSRPVPDPDPTLEKRLTGS